MNNDAVELLLINNLGTDETPNIAFTDSTGLDADVHTLTMADPLPKNAELNAESIHSIMNNYDSLKEGTHVLSRSVSTESFQNVSNALGTKISNITKTMRNVKSCVDSIVNETKRNVDLTMSLDPVLIQFVDKPFTDVTLPQSRWGYLDKVNERVLVDQINAKHHLNEEHISKIGIDYMLNDLPQSNRYNHVDLYEVGIPEEKAEKIANKVFLALNKKVSQKRIRRVLATTFALNDYQCSSFISKLRSMEKDFHKAITINAAMEDISDYLAVLPLLTEEFTGLAASSYAELDKHIQILAEYTKAYAYMCSYYRNDVWKDAILLPGRIVNSDNWKDFTEKGGDMLTILRHYVAYYHKNDKVLPRNGVTMDEVLRQKDVLQKEFAQKSVEAHENIAKRRAAILRDQFANAATNWMERNRKHFSKEFPAHVNLKDYALNIYDYQPNQPLETAAYNIILNTCYMNNPVNRLYKTMTNMYVKHAASTEGFSTEDMHMIDANVMSRMIIDMLFDYDIIKVD